MSGESAEAFLVGLQKKHPFFSICFTWEKFLVLGLSEDVSTLFFALYSLFVCDFSIINSTPIDFPSCHLIYGSLPSAARTGLISLSECRASCLLWSCVLEYFFDAFTCSVPYHLYIRLSLSFSSLIYDQLLRLLGCSRPETSSSERPLRFSLFPQTLPLTIPLLGSVFVFSSTFLPLSVYFSWVLCFSPLVRLWPGYRPTLPPPPHISGSPFLNPSREFEFVMTSTAHGGVSRAQTFPPSFGRLRVELHL